MAPLLKPQMNFTVYRGFQGSGAFVWSPFVTKLEARLRFAKLEYRTEAGSMFKAPRGKIPYMTFSKSESETPTVLGDTTLICENLVESGLIHDLNAELSPVEKALDLALRALLEDKLYWYQGYERWHENYCTMRSGALEALPYLLQLVIGLLAYRKNMRTMYGQGTGRFTAEEISSFKLQIWENINALLVDSRRKKGAKGDSDIPFWILGREEPSEADTTLFGFVGAGLVCTAAPETQKIIRSFPAIMDYAQRIRSRYFPDYESWDKSLGE